MAVIILPNGGTMHSDAQGELDRWAAKVEELCEKYPMYKPFLEGKLPAPDDPTPDDEDNEYPEEVEVD
jgi:hypothetical protein